MRTLLMVGGPHDGSAIRVPDHVTNVSVNDWFGVYQRKHLSPNVEVLYHVMPTVTPNRWEPRRRVARFSVDKPAVQWLESPLS